MPFLPDTMRLADFDYPLPWELVAQEPASRRDASRLLVVDREGKTCVHRAFANVTEFLQPGDVLVLNDTRVFPARLRGGKESGGAVELLLLRRRAGEGEVWEAMVKSATRPRAGHRVIFSPELWGEWPEDATNGRCTIGLHASRGIETALEQWGEVPLPPYIKRKSGVYPWDRERYQTVYAHRWGAVAAPTAGLHFTHELLATLRQQGIVVLFLTLHVGPGTFQPVRGGRIEEHVMEGEVYEIPALVANEINRAKREGRRVIAVGTTTTRALESASAGNQGVKGGRGEAHLFIYPGFSFHVIDGLVTNFHLPRSTLLLLLSAFAGRTLILSAYHEAIKRRYRFYSYGDAMLIL